MVYTEEAKDSKQTRIVVGRNQIENAQIYIDLKAEMNSNDSIDVIWLHLANTSSPHGFLVYPKKDKLPKDLLYRVATIVKKFSKLKKEQNVSVSWLPLDYVTSTDTPGRVVLGKKANILLA